jgi:hypothetical protein
MLFGPACYFYATQHILLNFFYAMAEQDNYQNSGSFKFSTKSLRMQSFKNVFHVEQSSNGLVLPSRIIKQVSRTASLEFSHTYLTSQIFGSYNTNRHGVLCGKHTQPDDVQYFVPG